MERLGWALVYEDSTLVRTAIRTLLSLREAGRRAHDLDLGLETASAVWGAGVAASFLDGAAGAQWSHDERGRLRLRRAALLHAGGDTTAAAQEARSVAALLGDPAAEARVLLARWALQRSGDLSEAYAVRELLIPVASHPVVSDLLGGLDTLERYTDLGLVEPLGWFAGAEVARDRLFAPDLARGLFLAYADGAPEEPWAPKALLAALDISQTPGDRAWLRGRLEAAGRNPYVLAAFGEAAPGFAALEEELRLRLNALTTR